MPCMTSSAAALERRRSTWKKVLSGLWVLMWVFEVNYGDVTDMAEDETWPMRLVIAL